MVHENCQRTLVIVENVFLMRVSVRIFSVDLGIRVRHKKGSLIFLSAIFREENAYMEMCSDMNVKRRYCSKEITKVLHY
jgi:hypothetical protein